LCCVYLWIYTSTASFTQNHLHSCSELWQKIQWNTCHQMVSFLWHSDFANFSFSRALLRALFPHSQPNPVDAISISLFGTCPYFFRLVLLDLVVGNLILKPCIVWGLTETFKIFLNICVNVLSLIHSSLSLHSTCLSYQTDYCSVKTALFSSFQANSLVCLLYKCKQVA